MTTILGLDLAQKTGLCVLAAEGPRLIWSDSVLLAAKDPGKRLLALQKVLVDIIERYHPDEIAMEDVFLPAKTSPRTPISLGELRGVARLCAARFEIPVSFYAPRQVKMTITGNGAAAKDDVIRLVESEFHVHLKDDNQADAISVAYTHMLARRFRNFEGVKV
ncbi:MAG TPA: crossover junction endodeoxyribonuclease RuvC [Candidatus Ozemobacteraceae bacterium]|nr:crossover junction endodeoxyribonuclease RuvC [Candidatus Ozemobacteraceae bacterium]